MGRKAPSAPHCPSLAGQSLTVPAQGRRGLFFSPLRSEGTVEGGLGWGPVGEKTEKRTVITRCILTAHFGLPRGIFYAMNVT